MSAPSDKVQQLQSAGVVLPDPDAVHVASEVVPERIAPGAVLHPGTRLAGSRTSIGPACEVGTEGPACLTDCQLEADVQLASGSFDGATLLRGVRVGPNAHVRPGCLLEEEASVAHCAGIKQTILLPFVTTGSLVNFCDVLMAGGTSRKNHSEVGSSYIHFNFTPQQDKATPSLIGDVPHGVMLDQPPIFLGGQGGLVGPARIAYGTVVAAGAIVRKDLLEPGRLHMPEAARATRSIPFSPGRFGSLTRKLENNLVFLGNLFALREWYRQVRARFNGADRWRTWAHEGACGRISEAIRERIKRLDELAGKVAAGTPTLEQLAFIQSWPDVSRQLAAWQPPAGSPGCGRLLAHLTATPATDYLSAIRALPPEIRTAATDWLQSIVDACVLLTKPS